MFFKVKSVLNEFFDRHLNFPALFVIRRLFQNGKCRVFSRIWKREKYFRIGVKFNQFERDKIEISIEFCV